MTGLEAWVRDGGEPLVIPTSGSTGAPKSALLSHRAVLASARASVDRLGGPGQWLLALPVSGVGGLQVLVRSILAGYEPVALSDHENLAAAFDAFAADRRYASIVPTQLYRWAEQGELGRLARFDAVLVGGAAIDPELVATAKGEGVNIVRTYGMTETCGGCVYDGVPLDGAELRVDDDGQVWLRGPMLFDGYVGEPHAEGTWFATSDRGEILPDGRLRVLGRIDDVVISGGVNVPLAAVEQAIRGMTEVADVAVIGAEDGEWGQRVVAAVVPAGTTPVSLAAVRDHVEAQGLPRTWGPRQVLVLPQLPVGATGKVDRVRLSTMARDPRV